MTEPEITPSFTEALELMEESSQHVFITGKAGTGKSTLLNHFRKSTKKTIAVLAPTGVAAINVGGQTVHSFFKFRPDTTPDSVRSIKVSADASKIFKALDTIVIDEVSMLRADLLDCIDRFLRLHGPERGRFFGGIQMVFIGDLYQLPPVVTTRDRELFHSFYKGPYFFHAKVIDEISLYMVELEKVYRQHDDSFISLLNAVRENVVTDIHLTHLNQRFGAPIPIETGANIISLTTTNQLAHDINERHLNDLPATIYTSSAVVTGNFQEKDFPTQENLYLKEGSQVMMLINDSRGRWVNGSLGVITSIDDDPRENDPVIKVKLSTGATISVSPFTWEISRYVFRQESGHLDTETVGTFRQYPLRLSWAVTIHKAQGKTFDQVVIDIGRGTFSPGQLYVALSRCTTLEGIVLKQMISRRNIQTDNQIKEFLSSFKDGMRQVGQASFSFGDDW
jgi:ATP-dependent exoDNAse (exonuclease V) alpha subunit